MRDTMHGEKEIKSAQRILQDMPEPYNKLQLFSIYSISRSFLSSSSLRAGVLATTNIPDDISAQLLKYKSIDLCSLVPGQVALDIIMNQDMERIFGKKFSDRYYNSIEYVNRKVVETKEKIFKIKRDNYVMQPTDAGISLFTRLDGINSKLFIQEYYRKYNEGLVAPGSLYGEGRDNYVNILINPEGDYSFLKH